MLIVKVKPKFQITIPAAVRERARIAVGDVLEARIDKNGAIVLQAKTIVDRPRG